MEKSASQVFFIGRNETVKFSPINAIYVKQQHASFFIFKFTLKYMLDNIYINKIHARQCLYIILYSLFHSKECSMSNFKTARKKRFFNWITSNWFLYVTMSGPFRIFPTLVWQNAHENSVRRAMVCDVYFSFSKILQFYKKVLCA